MMDLDTEIRGAVKGVGGLSVLVLFGSRAAGRARPDSDLDVGILPSAGAVDRRKLQSRVAALLADLSPGGRIDVVFLDEAPELLRQGILESGRVVILEDPRRWQELRLKTMREHGDREPYRRLLRQAQQRRLSGGAPSRG